MFGIGFPELVLIAIIALVVIGPKRLPDLAKALGRGYAEFRRASDELKRTFEEETRAARTDELRQKLLTEGKLFPPGTIDPYPAEATPTEAPGSAAEQPRSAVENTATATVGAPPSADQNRKTPA